MKVNKKKIIYLISPNKISLDFYQNLNEILSFKKVDIFQMRFKNYTQKRKIYIGKKVREICKKNKVKFIVNDDPLLAKKLNADGCHIGQNDVDIKIAKKILTNKIVGVTCHNSKKLAKIAINNGADYIAFGSFYKTQTKKVNHYARLDILKWAKNNFKIPIIAIGGINNLNFKKLIHSGASMVAISGFIWGQNFPTKRIKLF